MNNNSSAVKWLLFAALIGVMFFTNPKEEKHTEAVKKVLKKHINKEIAKQNENVLVNLLASAVANPIIDSLSGNFVSCDNYILFSLTKIQFKGEEKTVGIGILGSVRLFDGFESKLETLIKENVNNVISGENNHDNTKTPYDTKKENQLMPDALGNPESEGGIHYPPSNEEVGYYYINASGDHSVFFYSLPDISYRRNARFTTSEKVYLQKFENEFGYVIFTNTNGETSEGWILKSDMEKR